MPTLSECIRYALARILVVGVFICGTRGSDQGEVVREHSSGTHLTCEVIQMCNKGCVVWKQQRNEGTTPIVPAGSSHALHRYTTDHQEPRRMGVSGFIEKEWWQPAQLSDVIGAEDTVAVDWLATNFNAHTNVEAFSRRFQQVIACTEENALNLGRACVAGKMIATYKYMAKLTGRPIIVFFDAEQCTAVMEGKDARTHMKSADFKLERGEVKDHGNERAKDTDRYLSCVLHAMQATGITILIQSQDQNDEAQSYAKGVTTNVTRDSDFGWLNDAVGRTMVRNIHADGATGEFYCEIVHISDLFTLRNPMLDGVVLNRTLRAFLTLFRNNDYSHPLEHTGKGAEINAEVVAFLRELSQEGVEAMEAFTLKSLVDRFAERPTFKALQQTAFDTATANRVKYEKMAFGADGSPATLPAIRAYLRRLTDGGDGSNFIVAELQRLYTVIGKNACLAPAIAYALQVRLDAKDDAAVQASSAALAAAQLVQKPSDACSIANVHDLGCINFGTPTDVDAALKNEQFRPALIYQYGVDDKKSINIAGIGSTFDEVTIVILKQNQPVDLLAAVEKTYSGTAMHRSCFSTADWDKLAGLFDDIEDLYDPDIKEILANHIKEECNLFAIDEHSRLVTAHPLWSMVSVPTGSVVECKQDVRVLLKNGTIKYHTLSGVSVIANIPVLCASQCEITGVTMHIGSADDLMVKGMTHDGGQVLLCGPVNSPTDTNAGRMAIAFDGVCRMFAPRMGTLPEEKPADKTFGYVQMLAAFLDSSSPESPKALSGVDGLRAAIGTAAAQAQAEPDATGERIVAVGTIVVPAGSVQSDVHAILTAALTRHSTMPTTISHGWWQKALQSSAALSATTGSNDAVGRVALVELPRGDDPADRLSRLVGAANRVFSNRYQGRGTLPELPEKPADFIRCLGFTVRDPESSNGATVEFEANVAANVSQDEIQSIVTATLATAQTHAPTLKLSKKGFHLLSCYVEAAASPSQWKWRQSKYFAGKHGKRGVLFAATTVNVIEEPAAGAGSSADPEAAAKMDADVGTHNVDDENTPGPIGGGGSKRRRIAQHALHPIDGNGN